MEERRERVIRLSSDSTSFLQNCMVQLLSLWCLMCVGHWTYVGGCCLVLHQVSVCGHSSIKLVNSAQPVEQLE